VNVYRVDPIADARWLEFVGRSSRASVFHTPAWLEALRRTYGYTPVAYTTSLPGAQVNNGLVLCEIQSRLTGRRLVSVPFADHCEPLFAADADRDAVIGEIQCDIQHGRWKYLEMRPLTSEPHAPQNMADLGSFCFHSLDLRPPLDAIFGAFHKDSIQRKIRRAERESRRRDGGPAEASRTSVVELQLLTRRRHGLPPQPIKWFRNLIDCLGDRATIWLASKDTRPVAAILTLRHHETLVYKYGASDASVHNLGAMPFLFWNAIAEAKGSGIARLDLGRSDLHQAGLMTFKDRLGAERSTMTYLRYPAGPVNGGALRGARAAKLLLSRLPDWLLAATGNVLYGHMG
jgi:CelD/BcsL family acetyltransferase involved in cellulose biosynthesis